MVSSLLTHHDQESQRAKSIVNVHLHHTNASPHGLMATGALPNRSYRASIILGQCVHARADHNGVMLLRIRSQVLVHI